MTRSLVSWKRGAMDFDGLELIGFSGTDFLIQNFCVSCAGSVQTIPFRTSQRWRSCRSSRAGVVAVEVVVV